MPHPNPLVGLLPYGRGPMKLSALLAEQERVAKAHKRIRILVLCGAPLEAATTTVMKRDL